MCPSNIEASLRKYLAPPRPGPGAVVRTPLAAQAAIPALASKPSAMSDVLVWPPGLQRCGRANSAPVQMSYIAQSAGRPDDTASVVLVTFYDHLNRDFPKSARPSATRYLD